MYFTAQEEARLEEIISGIETKAGVQVLTAVVGKADAYPEVPWKAFALGASLTALILTVQALLDPPWIVPFHTAFCAAMVIGIGAVSALLATFLPPLARWFVTPARFEGEVAQYAHAFFLEREMFCTRERTGILLLVSLFERKVVVLPDSGVAARVSQRALAQVVARMTPPLSRGERYQALVEGLAELQSALLAAGFAGVPGAPDEIRDELVQRKGDRE
jgi:putative membrane protein